MQIDDVKSALSGPVASVYATFHEDGTLDVSNPEKYFTEKTKIVCVIHQSNVFGTVNPIQDIVQLAHDVDALVLIDGAQSVPHHRVDVSSFDCDFFCCSRICSSY